MGCVYHSSGASLGHLRREVTKAIHWDLSVDMWKLNRILRCVFPKLNDLPTLQSLIYAYSMPHTALVHGFQHQICLGASVRIWGFIQTLCLSVGVWSHVYLG